MIKTEKIETCGWEAALRGMRNPLNSRDKSDTIFDYLIDFVPEVGEADLDLMKRLCKAGTEHRKFMRMIHVSMDVTAPMYWWTEYDTYKIGTVANSTSKMHTLHKRDLTREDFSCEKLLSEGLKLLDNIIKTINDYRKAFNKTKNKIFWYSMMQLLPQSFHQTRTLDFNYEVAMTMIRQREGHKLDEWREFREELLRLPYMRELCGEEKE